MLVYHPAYDAHHCVFRLLAILESERSLDAEYVRLLDFVLCFPSVLADFRLPPQQSSLKSSARKFINIYRTPLNAKAMFLSLKPVCEGAMKCLAAAGFLSGEDLMRGYAVRTGLSLPLTLVARYEAFLSREAEFFGRTMSALLAFPLHGENGLKDRSGLMEYRYDAA